MALKYSTKTTDDILIFTIEDEEINHHTASELKEKLFLQISEGHLKIVLDMSGVKNIDSSGLGSLLFGKRQANSHNGDLKLVGVAEPVQNMIRIAQLSHVFETYDTIDDAIASFG